MRVLTIVNARAELLGASNLFGDIALDRYAFLRDAYLQRRVSLVYNGDPPDDGDDGVQYDDGDTSPEPEVPAKPQSLLLPEVEPDAVIWRRDLALLDELDASLPHSPLAGQVLAASLPSWTPLNMSEKAGFAALMPTAEELRGLRADADAR